MADDEGAVCVFFNPGCSKCRGAKELLEERGVEAEYYRYLDERPDRAELERVLGLLGTDDPRQMMRTGESVYKELGLADADRDALLDAMAEHPILIERPFVVTPKGTRLARPMDAVREIL